MMTQALSEGLSLTVEEFGAKFSLRINPDDLDTASKAFGLAIPRAINDGDIYGSRRAACLGPDEWVLYAEAEELSAIQNNFSCLSTPYALVDVTAREQRIFLSGVNATAAISVACPLDLSVLNVGQSKRTVFDSAQIVLNHIAVNQWELEVLRSFTPHVVGLLAQHG